MKSRASECLSLAFLKSLNFLLPYFVYDNVIFAYTLYTKVYYNSLSA